LCFEGMVRLIRVWSSSEMPPLLKTPVPTTF
jgi:hypothetical protein